jgi:hypothetical protein
MMEWVVGALRWRDRRTMTTAAMHAELMDERAHERKRRGVKDRGRSARNSLARALRSLTAAGTIKCDHGLWSLTAPHPDDVEAEKYKKRQLISTAWHEAGHAVIGRAGGLPITIATITPKGRMIGYVTGQTDRLAVGEIYGRRPRNVWKHTYKKLADLSDVDAFGNKVEHRKVSEAEHHAEVIMCIAGPMAQAMHEGEEPAAWKARASAGDMRIANYHRRELGTKARPWEQYERDTLALIREHWAKIEAVAKALLREKILSSYDLERVLVGVVKQQHLKKAAR